jgi:hypothetical protein
MINQNNQKTLKKKKKKKKKEEEEEEDMNIIKRVHLSLWFHSVTLSAFDVYCMVCIITCM